MPLSYQAIESEIEAVEFYDVDGTLWATDANDSSTDGYSGGSIYYNGWFYICGTFRDKLDALGGGNGRRHVGRWNPETDELQLNTTIIESSGAFQRGHQPKILDVGRGDELIIITSDREIKAINLETLELEQEVDGPGGSTNPLLSIDHRVIDGTSYLILTRASTTSSPIYYAAWEPGQSIPTSWTGTTPGGGVQFFTIGLPTVTNHGIVWRGPGVDGGQSNRGIGYIDLTNISSPTKTTLFTDSQGCVGTVATDGSIIFQISFNTTMGGTEPKVRVTGLTEGGVLGTFAAFRWDENANESLQYTPLENAWVTGSSHSIPRPSLMPNGDIIFPHFAHSTIQSNNWPLVRVLDKDSLDVLFFENMLSFEDMDTNESNTIIRELVSWASSPDGTLVATHPRHLDSQNTFNVNLIFWRPTAVTTFEAEIEFDYLPTTLVPFNQQVRLLHGDTEVPTNEWTFKNGTLSTITEFPAIETLYAVRETRTRGSWVNWHGAAHIHRQTDLNSWYNQRLFIFQEICELKELADLLEIDIPTPLTPVRPDTMYMEVTDGAGDPIDISHFEFLPRTMTGGVQHQLELRIQIGLASLILTYTTDETPDTNEWTIDVDGNIVVTVDSGHATADAPLIIERKTRLDRLWYFFRNAESFSSSNVNLVQKQLQFLLEEACALVQLPGDHALGNPLWPRDLNLLLFQGPQGLIKFGQFGWSEDGGILVYVNDILVEDYTIDWDLMEIDLSGLDLDEDDVVHITPGGGSNFVPGWDFGDEQGEEDGDGGGGDYPTTGPPLPPWQPPPPELLGSVAPFYWKGLPLWGDLPDPTAGNNNTVWVGRRFTNNETGQQAIIASVEGGCPHATISDYLSHHPRIGWAFEPETGWSKFDENTTIPCEQNLNFIPSWVADVIASINTLPLGHPARSVANANSLDTFNGIPVSSVREWLMDEGSNLANSVGGLNDPSQITLENYIDWINQ